MIQVLPESLINKIAAGEVITRPASVIKELVENSIDAGATRIVVELGNSCRDLRVRDNGRGISREDAALALVRHATSKIREFDDLYALTTRGFRGEALASISAVSRMQILTRRHGNVAGTRVIAEGPGAPRVESAGAPEGSDVQVRDLFYNTPARLKFMKSAASELQQILLMITRQALILPPVAFTVTNEKDVLIDLPPDQPWGERVATLLGSNIIENLLEIQAERHGITLRGFVLRPAVSRKDRRHQFFFVNGRPVTSRGISFVLQEAYRGVIMVQRFPVAVLDIVMPPSEVDVNVHPTKEEVRFRNEALINGVVHRVVHEALQAANLVPTIRFDDPRSPTDAAPVPQFEFTPPAQQTDLVGASDSPPLSSHAQMPGDFTTFTQHVPTPVFDMGRLQKQVQQIANATMEMGAPATELPENDLPSASADCTVRPVAHSIRRLSGIPEQDYTTPAASMFRGGFIPEPLGQIAKCYIAALAGDDLLLIDQHAAHERLQYLRFSSMSHEPSTQPLLIPVSVDVPATAMAYITKLLPVFHSVGLHVESFGGQTFLVQMTPTDLPNLDVAGVVADLLDDFDALEKVDEMDVLRDRIITRMACRSAIKAGQQLHLEEMRALIRDIAHARLGFTCPHGRPTMILLTRDQLDRQFKRKL